MSEIQLKARQIQLLILDVDGVMTSGGAGAVREVTDFILEAQNLLDAKQASYLE